MGGVDLTSYKGQRYLF